MLALAFTLASLVAADPPPDLAKRVARREAENEAERANYTYRQTIAFDELDKNGARVGDYREVREVIFSPKGERTDQVVGKPSVALKNMKMTEEDFRDFREIQPLLLTPDALWNYETKYKGEETIDGVDCWLLQVRPRQILQGQRFFDGIFWVDKRDYSIVRSEGQAVPQILSTKAEKENLFPRFTTLRAPVNGFWFPVETYANDTLHFRSGPQRVRLTIRYADYKRFGADSKITFQK